MAGRFLCRFSWFFACLFSCDGSCEPFFLCLFSYRHCVFLCLSLWRCGALRCSLFFLLRVFILFFKKSPRPSCCLVVLVCLICSPAPGQGKRWRVRACGFLTCWLCLCSWLTSCPGVVFLFFFVFLLLVMSCSTRSLVLACRVIVPVIALGVLCVIKAGAAASMSDNKKLNRFN